MIKVLHLITGLELGGAEMMLARLVINSNSQDLQNVVVTLTGGGALAQKIEMANVPLYSLGMQRGRPSPKAIWQLLKIIKKEQPDVVQSWLYHANLLGLLVTRLSKPVPLVWAVHNSYLDMSQYRRLSGWTVQLCRLVSRLPKAIVTVSQVSRLYHQQIGFKPQEWVFIPNGIDTSEFKPDSEARQAVRQALGLAENTALIGLFARFDPQKDHRNFIKAAEILSQRLPNVHFLLAGQNITPENAELAEWIAAAGLAGRVHLLGVRLDTARLMAGLDVAGMASAFGEALPLVLGEAMACGVPCVATDVGDCAQIIGETGKIVPPRNPLALAEAWQGLLALALEERQELGQRARQRVEQAYSLQQTVQAYSQLYARMAQSRKAKKRPAYQGSVIH